MSVPILQNGDRVILSIYGLTGSHLRTDYADACKVFGLQGVEVVHAELIVTDDVRGMEITAVFR